MSGSLFPPVDGHVIDTNLFIAFERHDAVELLERAATEHGVELLVPERVYTGIAYFREVWTSEKPVSVKSGPAETL